MEEVENRSFVRVPFKSTTILKSQNVRIEGTIKNLSLAGAFINTREKIERDTEVEIEMIFDNAPSAVSVMLSGKVVRLEPEGIAIQFTDMSTGALARIHMEIQRLSVPLGTRIPSCCF